MDIRLPKEAKQESVEVFCCYARKDQLLLLELKTHLTPLQREGLITLWADIDINAGTEWEKEIHRYLDIAQIILLLVSPDFMASDYCYSVEMKRAIERHERGEACAIPIILRRASWQKTPLGKLQALPTDANPITKWHDQDEAFYDVAEGIRDAVEVRKAAKAEQARLAEEERRRITEEAEQARLAEEERRRITEEAEQARLAEEERRRITEEAEQARLAEEERRRITEEAEQQREKEEERERLRKAREEEQAGQVKQPEPEPELESVVPVSETTDTNQSQQPAEMAPPVPVIPPSQQPVSEVSVDISTQSHTLLSLSDREPLPQAEEERHQPEGERAPHEQEQADKFEEGPVKAKETALAATELPGAAELEDFITMNGNDPACNNAVRRRVVKAHVLALGEIDASGLAHLLHCTVPIGRVTVAMLPVFTRIEHVVTAVQINPKWKELQAIDVEGSVALGDLDGKEYLGINPWSPLEFQLPVAQNRMSKFEKERHHEVVSTRHRQFIFDELYITPFVVWCQAFALLTGLGSMVDLLVHPIQSLHWTVGTVALATPLAYILAVGTVALATPLAYILGYRKAMNLFRMTIIALMSAAAVFGLTVYFSKLDFDHQRTSQLWFNLTRMLWLGRQANFGLIIGSSIGAIVGGVLISVAKAAYDFKPRAGGVTLVVFMVIGYIVILIGWFVFAILPSIFQWGFGFGYGWDTSLIAAGVGFVATMGLIFSLLVWTKALKGTIVK